MSRVLLVSCLLTLFAGSALAQSFPAKPLTLYCPCPRNSANEIYAHEFAKISSKYLGQPLVVQMPPTAESLGIADYLTTARPDGHSLFLMHIYILRLPHLQRDRLPWHPIEDFSYIIGLAGFTFGVVVKADSNFKAINDLISYAKANPGKLRYGAISGSTQHLAMEELGLKTGAKFERVSGLFTEYVAALTEGRIQAISDSAAWGPYVDAGTFRLLMTFGERRSKWDAPTAKESGFDVLAYSPFGFVAPKGTEPARARILHDAFNRALDDPEYDKLLKRLEMVDWYKSSEDYAEWAVDQFKFQRNLIERTIGLGRGGVR